MLLTIQQFSEKTGLSPSTLRFYDRKNILVPETRLENGYRAYNESQIPEALMIHSLRNADICIDDIKQFMIANEDQKNRLISKWRKQVENRLISLRVAGQYLGGLNPKETSIYLTRWEEPRTFLWFKYDVKRKFHPFREAMVQAKDRAGSLGIKCNDHYFVRIHDSIGMKICGEVGFIVEPSQLSLIVDHRDEDLYMEKIDPTLFAVMECSIQNEFLCFQFIQLVKQFGFTPQGQKIEKYTTPDDEMFQYLIPLINHK